MSKANPYSNTADALPVVPESQKTLPPPAAPRGSALLAFLKPDIIPNAFLIVRYAKKSDACWLACCCCCPGQQPPRSNAFNVLVNGESKTKSRISQGGGVKLEVPANVVLQVEAVENGEVSTGTKPFGPFEPRTTRIITLEWRKDKGGTWTPVLYEEE